MAVKRMIKNQLFEQIVCKKDGYVGHLGSHPFSTRAGIPDITQNFTHTVTKNAGGRAFVSYHVYKGKAAVSIEPCMPTFTKSGNLIIDRRGSIMLTFAPAMGERKYDWTRKQLFALSATEVGSLISMGPKDSCEFFHDPGMLSSTAGQVRKNLAIKAHTDGNGYMISLKHQILNKNKALQENGKENHALLYAFPIFQGIDKRLTQFPYPRSMTPSLIKPSPIPN
ncbi:single-stranded DNA-bindig protein WHY2 [Cucumis melo var. makuwa]|uniref:Single-stranded DNA-bindig protein WHY2 n=1 Tax=Cucumis melo var. makuwa TaxID=1194695 RepID=A0A5A7T798_CUCMM|nr:single-stranded DNA-bindig protein WHY2 [Cucumis melo var. makuwa]TYK00535.1 single-stranded DNA-bindig protein WHY2 [Cucumis melo var. makuwa]